MNRSGTDLFFFSAAFEREGNYTAVIKARDAAGNEAVLGALSFTIAGEKKSDNKPPPGQQGPDILEAVGWGLVILAGAIIAFTIWDDRRKRPEKPA
jgi:hypothetical protein